jgi:hypothetical protein
MRQRRISAPPDLERFCLTSLLSGLHLNQGQSTSITAPRIITQEGTGDVTVEADTMEADVEAVHQVMLYFRPPPAPLPPPAILITPPAEDEEQEASRY